MAEIIIYSSTGCPYCEKMKKEFKEWGYDYEERNVTENPAYFEDLHKEGMFSTPVVYINGEAFIGYRPKKMKKALGITDEMIAANKPTNTSEEQSSENFFQEPTKEMFDDVYDFVTIGAGPAGASAAVYASRARLKTLIIDKAPASGTLAITHKIANYPGVPEELTGQELLRKMHVQAHNFGTTFVRSNVLSVDFSNEDIKLLELPEGTIKAKSVFIAVGAKAPGSKIKGEEEYTGRGVSYCSTCDAAFFKDRIVGVVGDTEEAVHETQALAKFAKEVMLFVPTNKLKGEANTDELEKLDNVKIYWNHRLKEIIGNKKVEKLIIRDADKHEGEWAVDGVFLYLAGLKPGTDFLKDAVKRDEEGYIMVDEALRTSVDGVFAGGDARRTLIKQAVISAADGCIAALGADQHVNKRKTMKAQYS
ncbi:FAD-dependent oxidoreductase [Schinkia azotoformans]|uniref:FAD-dependent pyridine nucleotide-disulfide oxidoreductase n=1 Tax=Schinkia azotoformans LMG 9581 TaxID=1131731 RepID=K6DJ90_SCHAZ|nr:FAD-dependent oxidoreductase [Schinkia azotoformans]EKN68384.1 FAD-dependent pyridine nucleotide-disulfide oxidoreductase [Schinkia azotoformans LMG 9581]MEC1638503.1 FAD-dependent oxidoreductase [Schinkia azotoformans]MEC1721360.1 FAD-dependent oxidoreductase [Schinkia azotoformans]MEC1946063.1 FAD-dependent oxidoreductase [Schinkia azotoformans]MED4414507.1 FAD-dependent oxidoreductase [Schinkia azotoformans]